VQFSVFPTCVPYIRLSYDVDEVGVRQHVTSAAQLSEAEVIQHLSGVVVGEEDVHLVGHPQVVRGVHLPTNRLLVLVHLSLVVLPFVTEHFVAREAAYRDDHRACTFGALLLLISNQFFS